MITSDANATKDALAGKPKKKARKVTSRLRSLISRCLYKTYGPMKFDQGAKDLKLLSFGDDEATEEGS